MDERGSGYIGTAFFADIKLYGRSHPAFFTAGHVFDLTESGVDSEGLEKVHLVFNNLKVREPSLNMALVITSRQTFFSTFSGQR